MLNFKSLYLASVLLSIFLISGYSQEWVLVESPYITGAGQHRDITANNYCVLIVGKYGLYRSTDNGLTWVDIKEKNGLPSDAVYNNRALHIESDDSIILLATYKEKLYKSVNNGLSWIDIFTPPDSNWNFEGLGIRKDTVFFSWHTFYRSVDGGTSWLQPIGSPSRGNVSILGQKTIIISPDGISRDGGETFSKLNESIIRAIRTDPEILYGVLENAPFVKKSTDNGITWLSVNYDPVNIIDSSAYDIKKVGKYLYVLTKKGVYISEYGSTSWKLYGGTGNTTKNGIGKLAVCRNKLYSFTCINSETVVKSIEIDTTDFPTSVNTHFGYKKQGVSKVYRHYNILGQKITTNNNSLKNYTGIMITNDNGLSSVSIKLLKYIER